MAMRPEKAEGRRQKAEGRRQKAEGRRQKAEGRFTFEGVFAAYCLLPSAFCSMLPTAYCLVPSVLCCLLPAVLRALPVLAFRLIINFAVYEFESTSRPPRYVSGLQSAFHFGCGLDGTVLLVASEREDSLGCRLARASRISSRALSQCRADWRRRRAVGARRFRGRDSRRGGAG